MKLVVATNNGHKLTEFKRMLSDYFEEIYSLKDMGIASDAEETGTTFIENARIKAKAVEAELIKKYGKNITEEYAVLADDSGLSVDALGGEPGVTSARYASVDGRDASDEANRRKLLDRLEGVESRNARFTSALVLIVGEGEYVAEGHTEGYILHEERGSNGFGYDCIFESAVLNKSFGEASDEEKDSVSHRGFATEKLIEKFSNNF